MNQLLKIILYLVGAIGVYVLFELCVFGYKVSTLPTLPKPDQSDKILGNGPSLKYIAAGDSVAVGYGASTLDKSFAGGVANYLAKNYTVNYKNIAVIGYKTQDLINNQLSAIVAFQPDIIGISITANDATHLVAQNKIIANYKTIVSELKSKTSAKIYITDVPNFNSADILPTLYIKLLEHRSVKINRELLKLEDNRVRIVNIHDFGWKNYPDLSKTFAADHFHPNDLGYENWTNAFLDKITKDY